MGIAAGLVIGYLSQGIEYYSERQGEMVKIIEMHPAHAANAAEKMLRDAESWVDSAGLSGKVRYPRLWMTRTAVFHNLAAQAG